MQHTQIQIIQTRWRVMFAPIIRVILLTVILFLPAYSQEPHKQNMQLAALGNMYGSQISGIPHVIKRRFDLNKDTLEFNEHFAYILFGGTVNKYKNIIKIQTNSIIRKSSDFKEPLLKSNFDSKSMCPDKIYEENKDYLFLSIVTIKDFDIRGIICNDILPDTPANREVLINKFENKVIINEP